MSNLISSEFKALFNSTIDQVLAENTLAIPCVLSYESNKNSQLCNNCFYDPLTKASSYRYNGTGPISFLDGQTCPVCSGFGMVRGSTTETLHLGVILDSKYFLNWDAKNYNIPEGAAQTICSNSLISKLKSASNMEITVNNVLYNYQRAGDPMPIGFGSMDYIITNWTRQ